MACGQAQQAQAIAHVTGSSSRLEVVCFLPLYCIAQLTGRPHTAILLLSRLFFHDLSLFQKLFGPNAGREAYASLLMGWLCIFCTAWYSPFKARTVVSSQHKKIVTGGDQLKGLLDETTKI
jgi:hypothetical protein